MLVFQTCIYHDLHVSISLRRNICCPTPVLLRVRLGAWHRKRQIIDTLQTTREKTHCNYFYLKNYLSYFNQICSVLCVQYYVMTLCCHHLSCYGLYNIFVCESQNQREIIIISQCRDNGNSNSRNHTSAISRHLTAVSY